MTRSGTSPPAFVPNSLKPRRSCTSGVREEGWGCPSRAAASCFSPRRRSRTGAKPEAKSPASGRGTPIPTGQAPLEERAALVFAEDVAHRAADLADRGVGGERGTDRVQEVALAVSDGPQLVELLPDRGLVAALLESLQPRQLARLK